MAGRSTAQVRAARNKKKNVRGPQARNPADIKAGIDASKIGVNKAAQRTGTAADIKEFERTGTSPANERALRATGKGRGEFTGPLPDPQGRSDQPTPPIQIAQTQPLSDIPAEPIIAPDALNEGLVNADILAQGQQLSETPTPENFARDVAIGTAGGAAAIAIGTALAAVGSGLILTEGLAAPTVSKAAQGISQRVEASLAALGKGPSMTSVVAKKILSLLTRTIKSPVGIGAIGSYAFSVGLSFNEGQGDVSTTLDIAHREAIKENDLVGANEIKKMQDEVWSAANIAKNFIPFLGNFLLADFRKVKATNLAIRNRQKNADKNAQEEVEAGPKTPTPEEIRQTFIEGQR